MDEKVFLVDRQIADRCSLDPNSVPNQICLVSLREFRSILSEQGDGIAVVANENRLGRAVVGTAQHRSEEHTSELQSLMRSSYAVFCLKKNKTTKSKNK